MFLPGQRQEGQNFPFLWPGGVIGAGSPPQRDQPPCLHIRSEFWKRTQTLRKPELVDTWFSWMLVHTSRTCCLITTVTMSTLQCGSEVGPLVLEPWPCLLGAVHSAECVSRRTSFHFDGAKVALMSLTLVSSSLQDWSKTLVMASHLLCRSDYPSSCLEFNLISWSSWSYMPDI